jgi:hypothetical protein
MRIFNRLLKKSFLKVDEHDFRCSVRINSSRSELAICMGMTLKWRVHMRDMLRNAVDQVERYLSVHTRTETSEFRLLHAYA